MKRPQLSELAAWAGIAGLLIAILTYLGLQPNGEGASTSTGPSHSSSATTHTSSSISNTSIVSTEPSTSTTPTSAGPQPTFTFELGPDSYADLDHGTASEDGGRKYEVNLDFTGMRLFHQFGGSQEDTWPSKYRLIAQGRYSYATCQRATRVVANEFVYVSELNDNNLCVSTSEGNWAIMELTGWKGTSEFSIEAVEFAVYLLKP